jgi:hypothetical protein
LGKGLATLSLDKEYQKARQKPDAKPTFLKNLGQNLVMVVDFVTIYLFLSISKMILYILGFC